MIETNNQKSSLNLPDSDEVYQTNILPGVSRTFALTIPQLPETLRGAVTNAYLLCRIADTIEDDNALLPNQKAEFLERFKNVVEGHESAEALSTELYPLLSNNTLADEKILIQNIARVTRYTQNLNYNQTKALQRCISIMAPGMHEFEHNASIVGLATMQEMDRYCYYVAGVVGEMLTELFCDYSQMIHQHKDIMMKLAPSFGQGLQMTNILKDVWEDRANGICWLPRDIFHEVGFDLTDLPEKHYQKNFADGLRKLIAIALAHLHNALDYTLHIPTHETGIRRFCLWAIGLAVLTLRNIYNNPCYRSGADVKVSRRMLKITILMANVSCSSDIWLRRLFHWAAKGMPEPDHNLVFAN